MLRYRLELAPEIDDYELLGKRTPNVKQEVIEGNLMGSEYDRMENSNFLEKLERNQNDLKLYRQENSLSNINGLFNIVEVDAADNEDDFADFERYEKNR
jgi:hypothetical protein